MKTEGVFLASFWLLAAASAGESVTNYVAGPANFRIVTNQVFNTERSKLWTNHFFQIEQVRPDGVIALKWYSAGVYSGYAKNSVFVRNFPTNPPPIDGESKYVKVMEVGAIRIGSQTLKLYDAGAPYMIPVVRTNSAQATGNSRP